MLQRRMACSQKIPASLKLIPSGLVLFLIVQCCVPTAHAIYYQILMTKCSTTANDSSSSTYQSNLNSLLSTLKASTPATGYNNLTVGRAPDQVYGLAQCRGDESSSVCQTCMDTATSDIVRNCSRARSGTLWYEECFLRYSDDSFFAPTSTSAFFGLCNVNNVSDAQLFNTLLGNLIDDLSRKAAYSSPKMYATGSVNYTSFQDLYAMVQCTRDLSPLTCYKCIQDFRSQIPSYCGIKQGGRIFGLNCYIRYEIGDIFYNTTNDAGTITPPPPLTASPPSTNATNTSQEGTPSGGKSSNTKTAIVIAIPVAAAVLLLVIVIFLCFHRRRKQRNYGVIAGGENRDAESTDFSMFNLDMLKAATNNFSEANKLGEGGFGPVYKGKLRDGGLIAVKRLSKSSGQGLVELKNEVALVLNLQHKNLVRLMGCCLEEEEKLLVYEYLPNTSLDKVIFDPTRRTELDWTTRYKIVEGIARGLLYLHEDSRLKIVHRDLKASNILLDKDMMPKISDFGLAKLFDMEETHRNTSKIAGTYGYMAPEYAMQGIFSVKSDVFSYGVLVLEIVSGRRNSGYDGYSGLSANLLSYVWQTWNQGRALEIVDQTLLDQYQSQEVIRCIHIGLLCVQEDPAERPNMTMVILMLSSNSMALPSPSPPAFILHSRARAESDIQVSDTSSEHMVPGNARSNNNTKVNSREISNNDLTITEMEVR